MKSKDFARDNSGEDFALFLDGLKQLSLYMQTVLISSENQEQLKEDLDDRLRNLKRYRRKAEKMKSSEDVGLFRDVTQYLERIIRFSLIGDLQVDLDKDLEEISNSFGNLKKVYGMRGSDKVKSIKLARDVEESCEEVKKRFYNTLEDSEDEFEREVIQKLLDLVYELQFLGDNFITSVDSRIK